MATSTTSFIARTLRAQKILAGQAGKPFQAFNQPFVNAAAIAGQTAAKKATDVSRATFNSRLSGRPLAPARQGRPTTSGKFAQFINWDYKSAKDSIELDLGYLSTAAPYWAIQEIGTNHSARIIASPSGPGQVSVRSQRGRKISSALVWASGPGGRATPATRGNGQEQLFLRSQVLASNVKLRRMRINREIKAKHYLRDGAKSAFNLYRKDMTKAFRQAYK